MTNTAKTTLQARLDPKNKQIVAQAAKLRNIGLSDYIRLVLASIPKKEVDQAKITFYN